MIDLASPTKRLVGTDLHLDVLALLAFPIVLLLVNDSWSFLEPAPWVDPYIYEGLFLDLKQQLLLHNRALEFPYYSSRLPWILLGNAAYSIASPDTANLLLRLLLLYTGITSIYWIVRQVTGSGLVALISALLLGSNAYFLWSIGWDYVDGPGLVAILLALAFLTKAALAGSWRVPLCFGGSAAAVAVSINIFLVVAMPSLIAWYLLINTQGDKHALVRSIAYLAIGGMAAIALFGVINAYLTGNFYYLEGQIKAATNIDATLYEGNAFSASGWLVIPGVALALSAALLGLAAYQRLSGRILTRLQTFGVASAVAFLTIFAIYLFLKFFMMSKAFEFSFYVSYLLPFAFLVIAACLGLAFSELKSSLALRCSVLAVVLVGVLAPFVVAELRFMPGCPGVCLASASVRSGVLGGSGLVILALLSRSASLALAGLVVLSLVNVGVADRRILIFSEAQNEVRHRRFLMVFDAAAAVRPHNENGDLRYWFNAADPYAWVFAGVAAQNLWNARLVSMEFPKVRPSMALQAGQTIAVGSVRADEVVPLANESLVADNLHIEVFDQVKIERGKDAFTILFIRVMPGARDPDLDFRVSKETMSGFKAAHAEISGLSEGGLQVMPAKAGAHAEDHAIPEALRQADSLRGGKMRILLRGERVPVGVGLW